MLIYVAAILFLLVIYTYQYLRNRKTIIHNFTQIPCEAGLPIIGLITKIERPFCNYLTKLSHKHGPIYQIRFGLRKIVILNSYEYIKAALVENGEALSGRWKAQKYVLVTNKSGLSYIEGNVWTKQRAFVLKTLRDFGVGRSRSMEIIRDECTYLLKDLEKFKGQSLNFASFMALYAANVILKFVMNKRYSRGDPVLEIIGKFMSVTFTANDPVADFTLMVPFLENYDWLMKFIIWITSRKSLTDDCHNLIEKEIKEHLKNLDFNSEGDDLIDRFLIKQHRMKEKDGNVKTYTDWQLVRNVFELIFAGYDTTSTSLVWCALFMAMYPKIQTKVHDEIIDKIGNERMPTMSDKVKLTYTQAVMDEIFRLSTIAPLALLHRTLSDITIKEYFLPKDTLIIPNILACHLDPKIWTKPFEFYPEHFLITGDNDELKYKPREELIIFSLGKRQCLGESLARMEMFMFFTSILQRFQVKMVNEKPIFDPFSGNEGIIRTPDVEEFIFEKRP